MYTSYDLVNGSALLGRKTLSSHKLSFFFIFYQSTELGSRRVDGHQIYSRGLVVTSKASTIGIEVSPNTPLMFTGGSKSAKFCVVYITQIWAARVWKCSNISEIWNKSAMLR